MTIVLYGEPITLEGCDYMICGIRGHLFDPADFDIVAAVTRSTGPRGFDCRYEVRDDRLWIATLDIVCPSDAKERTRQKLERLFKELESPQYGRPGSLIGREPREPFRFTGGLIIGRDPIMERLPFRSHFPVLAQRDVLELVFESGELVQTIDHSDLIGQLRDHLRSQPDFDFGELSELAHWILFLHNRRYHHIVSARQHKHWKFDRPLDPEFSRRLNEFTRDIRQREREAEMEEKRQITKGDIPTTIGRLLYELSWEGHAKDTCRIGGRGRENVLTTEVMQVLDWLPRTEFLGEVVRAMHGAEAARERLVSEIEAADLQVLPEEIHLRPSIKNKDLQIRVQPDGHLATESVYCLIEAKRIKKSAFQPKQPARELVAAMKTAGARTPLLMLLLGDPPPLKVRGEDYLQIPDAVALELEHVIDHEVEGFRKTYDEILAELDDLICWITWAEIGHIVYQAAQRFETEPPSISASIRRMAANLETALQWHSR